MKTCFIVTSSIQVTEKRLTYSEKRSIFSNEERFRQTMYTMSSIKSNFPDAKIYMVESSENYKEYEKFFKFFFNVDFFALEHHDPTINYIVRNHPHKSYCESLLIRTFMKQKMNELIQYDIIYKLSGRYAIEINNKPVDPTKIYFKKPLQFKWSDEFSIVDRRSIENHDGRRELCTVLYAYGSKHLRKMLKIHETIMKTLSNPKLQSYDLEILKYFYSREFDQDIVETNWVVAGYWGPSGMFVRY